MSIKSEMEKSTSSLFKDHVKCLKHCPMCLQMGDTPLHVVSRGREGTTMAALLIEKGADVNARDKVGKQSRCSPIFADGLHTGRTASLCTPVARVDWGVGCLRDMGGVKGCMHVGDGNCHQ